ncbi:hypothetical protein [Nocardioides sp. HB32]
MPTDAELARQIVSAITVTICLVAGVEFGIAWLIRGGREATGGDDRD